jgi:hypothetical protein
MINVVVPVEVSDELLDEIFKEVLEGETGNLKIIVRQRLKCQHLKLVEHFQANPITPDAEKAANYWRAMHCHERPDFIPAEIIIKFAIHAGAELFGPGTFECKKDSVFGPYVDIEGLKHALHWLPLGSYIVTKWRKNEADNAE